MSKKYIWDKSMKPQKVFKTPTKSPHQVWLSGFTRRWHARPLMNEVQDFTAAHSARMAALALRLWPNCSKELLAAIIVHDSGEIFAGDLPYDFKLANPKVSESHSKFEDKARENLFGVDWVNELEKEDYEKLKLLDRVDSHLLVLLYHPGIASTKPWQDQVKRDYQRAESLGCYETLFSLMKEAGDISTRSFNITTPVVGDDIEAA